jgi:RNA polymerase sigma factor (sigma-70 family)
MSEKEFKDFFDANWRGHYWFAYKILPADKLAAEDAVQVAYIKAWKAIKNKDFDRCSHKWGAISNWIRKTIVNKIIDYQKHKRRGKIVIDGLPALSESYVEAEGIKSEFFNSICLVLSIQQKRALDLYAQGYSYPDIATILKIKIVSARTHVKRGLDSIRNHLGVKKIKGKFCNKGHALPPSGRCKKCEAELQYKLNYHLYGTKLNPYTI